MFTWFTLASTTGAQSTLALFAMAHQRPQQNDSENDESDGSQGTSSRISGRQRKIIFIQFHQKFVNIEFVAIFTMCNVYSRLLS